MLALQSADAAADRADFEAHGLPVFAPFDFEWMTTGPDGSERKVAFSLTFTREPRLREAGYFNPRGGMPIDVFWQTGVPLRGVWLPDQGVAPYRGRG